MVSIGGLGGGAGEEVVCQFGWGGDCEGVVIRVPWSGDSGTVEW